MNAEIDAALESYRATVASVQAAYLATHGRYAQGLPTHSTPPTVGSPSAPDALLASLHDQSDTWSDLMPQSGIPELWRFSLAIDVYGSGAGVGYRLVAAVKDGNGDTWTRTIDEGPQGGSAPWSVLPWDI